jgi:RHS repeat-associated protein
MLSIMQTQPQKASSTRGVANPQIQNRSEGTYRGEQCDSDLSFYYLRARYYNPLTGRFMSRDPNDPQLRNSDGIPTDPRYLHKYLYANGDPINGIDPSGRGPLPDTVVLYTSIVPPLAATAVTVASYADCIVHSSSDLASAIQTLSSVRNPFEAVRCALNLLGSIGNEPLLKWLWTFEIRVTVGATCTHESGLDRRQEDE